MICIRLLQYRIVKTRGATIVASVAIEIEIVRKLKILLQLKLDRPF